MTSEPVIEKPNSLGSWLTMTVERDAVEVAVPHRQ